MALTLLQKRDLGNETACPFENSTTGYWLESLRQRARHTVAH
jgi:hypothetical protein